jgi:hypothetical protein
MNDNQYEGWDQSDTTSYALAIMKKDSSLTRAYIEKASKDVNNQCRFHTNYKLFVT